MLKEENNCSLLPIKYKKTRWKSWNFHYSTGYKLELHKKKIYEVTNYIKKSCHKINIILQRWFCLFLPDQHYFFGYHMLGTLIKMYTFQSYPALSFPVAFFLVRHLLCFLCCAMCLAWHWQINSHSLHFQISSCVNLTPQLQRTPVLFWFSFFSPSALFFFRRCQTNPPLWHWMLSVNNNHHLLGWLQGINDSITANVFSIYHRTWQSTTLGAQMGQFHFCYCGYFQRKALFGSTRA